MNRAERRRRARERARSVAVGENVALAGLGELYSADDPHAELPDKLPGVHRWVAICTYSVPDPWRFDREGPMVLDLSSLVYSGLGCYDCEMLWSPDVDHRCSSA